MWHGYIVVRKHVDFTPEEWQLLTDNLQVDLDGEPEATRPCDRLHSAYIDSDTLLIESTFDENQLNWCDITQLPTLMALHITRTPEWLQANISQIVTVMSTIGASWLASHAAAERYSNGEDNTLDLIGCAGFNANLMPSAMRQWHDKLMDKLTRQTYPDALAGALGADLYIMARPVAMHILACHMAFRATGDFNILDHAETIMEAARSMLADYDDDGLLEWVYGENPNVSPDLWGKDTALDKNMADAMVAEHCYVLYLNRDRAESYNEHYLAWLDYIQNHAMQHTTLVKSLMHCLSYGLRWYFYAYRLTGDQTMMDELVSHALIFNRAMIERQRAFVWDHRVVELYNDPRGCQPTNYSQYVAINISDLACEGVWPFSSSVYMHHFFRSATDLILSDYPATIHGDVCGDCDVASEATRSIWHDQFTSQRWAIWGWQSVAAWGNPGILDDVAMAAEQASPTSIFMAALMTFTIGYRYWTDNGNMPWKIQ